MLTINVRLRSHRPARRGLWGLRGLRRGTYQLGSYAPRTHLRRRWERFERRRRAPRIRIRGKAPSRISSVPPRMLAELDRASSSRVQQAPCLRKLMYYINDCPTGQATCSYTRVEVRSRLERCARALWPLGNMLSLVELVSW